MKLGDTMLLEDQSRELANEYIQLWNRLWDLWRFEAQSKNV